MLLNLPAGLKFAALTSLCLTPITATLASVLSAPEYLDLISKSAPNNTWTLHAEDLAASSFGLKQKDTNGKSKLGSFEAPTFKKYISDRRRQTLAPWGSRTTTNTPPSTPPNTGAVRTYNFTIARSRLAPDGVDRLMMLVNGKFPGPTIEANWGDTIVVNVQNSLDNEGTSLHWHGMLQTNTNDQDGVPGVTQCPIAPGQSYTYSFQASTYGTSWYHAHYSAQYTAGLYGAVVIHGPTDNAPYDVDLGPVLLSDYYYQDYYQTVKDVMGIDSTKISPPSDNNLINGKGSTNCALSGGSCTSNAGLARFQLETGKKHRLRLINAGAEAIQKFSVDNHILTVIAVDFTPIVPYQTNVVTLTVGQRMDVLMEATGRPTDSVYMRSIISTCSRYRQPNAFALVYYPNADQTNLPSSIAQVDTTNPCAEENISKVVPSYSWSPSPPEQSLEVDITISRNATGNFLWSMNNNTFRADYNNPTLQSIMSGRAASSLPAEASIFNLGSSKSVQLLINNFSPVAHPMHMHGYDMFILAAGGSAQAGPQVAWDGSTVNAQNPLRRDTFLLQPNGYMVVQINSINPGVWPFHCHIAWHVSGGLYMNLLTQEALIPGTVKSTPSAAGLCTSWNAFTSSLVVDQIDSGL